MNSSFMGDGTATTAMSTPKEDAPFVFSPPPPPPPPPPPHSGGRRASQQQQQQHHHHHHHHQQQQQQQQQRRGRLQRVPNVLIMMAWFVVVIVVGMLVSTKYGTMVILLTKDSPTISTAALARQQQQLQQQLQQEEEGDLRRDNNNNDATDEKEWSKEEEETTTTTTTSRRAILPPLDSLVHAHNYSLVQGANVSWLLDFAIIGFAKCGTTSLLRTLGAASPSTLYMLPRERCDLTANRPDQIVKYLYKEGPPPQLISSDDANNKKKSLHKGLKCPQDVENESSLRQYATTFCQTHLLVSLRHPVDWFESLYNFKHATTKLSNLPPTHTMRKGCYKGHKGVCAWRGNFHDYLARMGKTSLDTTEERNLLEWRGKLQAMQPPVNNPLFLCHVEQMGGSSGRLVVSNQELQQRGLQFRRDLSHFLQLPQEIPPLLHVSPQLVGSGGGGIYQGSNSTSETTKKKGVIDICDPQHEAVRQVLIRQGKNAAQWIQHYLLKSPTVTASDPETFVQILQTWSVDPCVSSARENATLPS